MRNALYFVAVIGLASGAFAQSEVPAKPVKEKKICKSLEKTGSIIRERTCMTQSQWDSVAKKNAANLERFANSRDSSRSVSPRSPGL